MQGNFILQKKWFAWRWGVSERGAGVFPLAERGVTLAAFFLFVAHISQWECTPLDWQPFPAHLQHRIGGRASWWLWISRWVRRKCPQGWIRKTGSSAGCGGCWVTVWRIQDVLGSQTGEPGLEGGRERVEIILYRKPSRLKHTRDASMGMWTRNQLINHNSLIA